MSRHLEAVRLADYAAGQLAPARRDEIAHHLSGCPDCRRTLSRVGGARESLRAIAEQPAPSLSPAGSARLEAALRWSGTQPAARASFLDLWRTRLAIGFCATAAAAAAIVVYARHRHTESSIVAHAVTAPAPTAPTVAMVPATAAQPHLAAIVTLVSGNARLLRGAHEQAIDPTVELATGDVLTTPAAARVGFQWGEGSGALVGGGSEIVLARLEPRAQELRLSRGSVSVRVGPHQQGESMRVVTRDHVVSVHGTWFVVGADARGTTVEVLEGVIEVGTLDGKETTRVAAPMRAFFAGATPAHAARAVGDDVRALVAREASALRAASEMALLPWKAEDLDGGIDAVLGSSGVLHIQTDPVAAGVAVDGVSFGSAPLLLRRIHGRHMVELSRPGFSTVSRWISVGMEPGELRTALPEVKAPRETLPSSPEEIQQLVKSRKSQIRRCYEHTLKRDPSANGQVTLDLRVGNVGQVLGSAVENDSFDDPTVAECLRHEVAGWVFHGARNITIAYPFRFLHE